MSKRRIRDKIMVPVRLERDLVKELDIIALKTNKFRSEIIREALADAVKKHGFFESRRS